MKRFLYCISSVFLLLCALPIQSFGQYCTPRYTGTGHPATGDPTPFFTHILRVSFSEIDRSTTAPTTVFYNTVYDDNRTDTAILTQTGSYPFEIELGNGANTQTFAIWIDYNQNEIFESTEIVATQTDIANVGAHKYSYNFKVPKNAVLGTTRMRIGTIFGTTAPKPCNNSRTATGTVDWSQHFQDYSIEILKPEVQKFESVTTVHTNFDEMSRLSDDNEILRIDVKTNDAGVQSPLSADSFFFNLLGTTYPDDVAEAKLYFTGKKNIFSTGTLVDSETKLSSGFALGGKVDLEQGTNYFWLTFDTDKDAIVGNTVDAQCTGVKVLTKRIPEVVSPNGNRTIGYCNSLGNKSNFIYVARVRLSTLDVSSTWNTGYQDNTGRSTTVFTGTNSTLTVDVGNGVNNSFTKVWIDYNADGDFNDVGEEVLFDSITNAATSAVDQVTASIAIPTTAKVGPTRMRVTSTSKSDQFPWKFPPNACDDNVDIGEVEDYTIYIATDGEPVSEFSSSTVCLGDSTAFIDQSYTYITTTTYSVSSWKWIFGDGSTSIKQNPKHKYAKGGIYKVSLIANTNKPGTADTTHKIVVVEDPKADFIVNSTLINKAITFTDQSKGGNVAFWSWNFDDLGSTNNIDFSPNPVHAFDTARTYSVTLEVTTVGGCKASIVKSIKIVSELPPIANFNAPSIKPYKGADIQLTDVSSNSPTSWKWSITPSTFTYTTGTSSSQSPVIKLSEIKKYTIKMVVENGAGKDSISKEFETKDYSSPAADFSANQTTVKAGQIVSFLDESTNDPTEWEWVFGDGDSSTMSNPIHEYDSTGTYSVKLNIENPAGKDSETKVNFIKVEDEYVMCSSDAFRSPLAKGILYDSGSDTGNYQNSEDCEFLINPSCGGTLNISFNSFSLLANDYIRIYDYDPDTDIKTALHTGLGFTGFSAPSGLKAVSGAAIIEIATDGNTTSGGFELEWSALPNVKPIAKLRADTVGYVNGSMLFWNETITGTKNSYEWDFDNDGIADATSNERVSYVFDKAGTYKVALIASNCKGTDTIFHTIRIKTPTAIPTTNFVTRVPGDTLIFAGEEVIFDDISTQGPTSWLWTVSGDPFNYLFVNNTADTSRSPEILFFEPGYYTLTLTTSNSFGKGSTERKTRYIVVKPDIRMCVFPFESDIESGRITDDGGSNGVYTSTSCDYLINSCGKEIKLEFTDFDYGIGDLLRVYDGTDNTGTALHTGTGFTSGDDPTVVVLTATSGAIFIEHRAAANNTTFNGFVANWSTVSYSDPVVGFTAPKEAYNKGGIAFFENETDERGNQKVEYHWDFNGDGVTDDNSVNPFYKFATTGTKEIELKVTACGFADSITQTVTVLNIIRKPLADFWVSRNRVSTTDLVTLRDSSEFGPSEWKWEITARNGGSFTLVNGWDTLPFMQMLFIKPDTYDVKLVVTNLYGKDSVLKKAEIISIEYCKPTVVNAPLTTTGISYFALGDIKNSTSPLRKYTDYSSTHSTQITQGGTHNVVIGRSSTAPPLNVKVWIDFDKNGEFNDTNETVLIVPSTVSDSLKGKFKVPTYVADGVTRLRVGTSLSTDNNTPCGPNNYGEFEDYEVVIGKDTTKPVITLKGNDPETVELGYTFNDPGATVYDNVEGDISVNLVVTDNIDNSVEGVYSVWYNAADGSGNKADEVVRTVNVGPDRTKPVVTLVGADPIDMDVFTKFVDPGATALDNIDGDISSKVTVDVSGLDTAVVNATGYTVIYKVLDQANNESEPIERTVRVLDREAPVITLNGSATVVIDLNTQSYVEERATIKDNYYTDTDLIISGTVDDKTVGTYTVYYDATDRSGNSAAQVERTVIVEDPIGFGEVEGLSKFEIYPNPANDVIFVNLDAKEAIDGELRILDLVGRELYVTPADIQGIRNVTIPVKNLSEGVYYLDFVTANGNSVRQKFSVIK